MTTPPGFERGLISQGDAFKHHQPQGKNAELEVLNIKNILSEEEAFDLTSFGEVEEVEELVDQMTTPMIDAKEFDSPEIPVPDTSDVDALLPETVSLPALEINGQLESRRYRTLKLVYIIDTVLGYFVTEKKTYCYCQTGLGPCGRRQ